MVNHVVTHDEHMGFVMEMAKRICRQSRFAVARAKEVVNASLDKVLTDVCAKETDAFVACFENADHAEGMQAFLEKREPRFGRAG